MKNPSLRLARKIFGAANLSSRRFASAKNPIQSLVRRPPKSTTTTTSSPSSSPYRVTIGLEVHAQIAGDTKLFSSARQSFGERPNSSVALLDVSMPGVLPVLNRRCVEQAVLTCLTLNCNVDRASQFDRKHYFYADMPAGYQITQHRRPIGADGWIEYWVYDRATNDAYLKRTRIARLQLEQDSAKSLQDEINHVTLVDLNRCGNALMEIVTDAGLSSANEAAAFVQELQKTLRLIGTCDANMDRGELRVDANVSIAPMDSKELGVRTEIKNINSVRHVHEAIEYEICRHTLELTNGRDVINETRGYDYKTGRTVEMRDKEVLQDYRQMPEPNLPCLRLADSDEKSAANSNPTNSSLVDIAAVRPSVPHESKLPRSTICQMIQEYGIPPTNVWLIINHPPRLAYFTRCLQIARLNAVPPADLASLARMSAVWIVSTWLSPLIDDRCLAVDEPGLMALLYRVHKGQMTEETAQVLVHRIIDTKTALPVDLFDEEDFSIIEDEEEIYRRCDAIVDINPKALKQYTNGKLKVFGFFTRMTSEACNYRIPQNILEERMEVVLRDRGRVYVNQLKIN